jgi:hypothetical protein
VPFHRSEEALNFILSKYGRQSLWPLCPKDAGQFTKRFLQNVGEKKEESVQCLILRAGGHTLVQSEMLKKLADFGLSHLDRMTFALKKNEMSRPVHVCVLGSL